MIKNSIIILIVIVGIAIFVYFVKYRNSDLPLPINSPMTESGIVITNSWENVNVNNWDSQLMRTWATVVDNSGVSVTIITNWPEMRAMTPEEQFDFEKKIQND